MIENPCNKRHINKRKTNRSLLTCICLMYTHEITKKRLIISIKFFCRFLWTIYIHNDGIWKWGTIASSFIICISFIFCLVILFHYLRPPVLCWISIMRADIFDLFSVEKFPSIPDALSCKDVDFFKLFFFSNWYNHMILPY